jgi:hypothetical protein
VPPKRPLEEYRKLAAGPKEAFDRVKAIQAEQAFREQTRVTAANRQTELAQSWVENPNEEAATKLSKLSARAKLPLRSQGQNARPETCRCPGRAALALVCVRPEL